MLTSQFFLYKAFTLIQGFSVAYICRCTRLSMKNDDVGYFRNDDMYEDDDVMMDMWGRKDWNKCEYLLIFKYEIILQMYEDLWMIS